MKKLFNVFAVLCSLFLLINTADAKSLSLPKLIDKAQFDNSATVAFYVKDLKSGVVNYSYNEKKLLHPASVLKLLTLKPSLDELGANYEFKTTLYKDNLNNWYLKVGADPLLTSIDLKYFVRDARGKGIQNFKNFYIDDSILDDMDWGIGWMWDDSSNPKMPKYSAYNLDGNVINVKFSPSAFGAPATMDYTSVVKYPIINQVTTGSSNKIKLDKRDWISPDIVIVSGTVKSLTQVKIPISDMKRYYLSTLNSKLLQAHVKVNGNFKFQKVPDNAVAVVTKANSIGKVIPLILKSSDNRCAETVFKLAGGHYKNSVGTTQAAIEMFNEYYKDLNPKDMVIADGSGVSRNNLLSAEFIGEAIYKIAKEDNAEFFKDTMAEPEDGTMSGRLTNLRGNLWAKTGTLSGVSSIAGIITNKKGKDKVFVIMIENHNKPEKFVKDVEDEIILKLYEN